MSEYAIDIIKEKNEAIQAGQRALRSLRAAADELKGARDWGILDMFGGGLISSLAKRKRMRNAQERMEDAKTDLRCFSRELQDVEMACNLNIETGDFLSFADWFFDGFFVDFMVQDRIRKAQEQVNEAIYQVHKVLEQLEKL